MPGWFFVQLFSPQNLLVEVEQAWARTRKPALNFWLTVNKPQARRAQYLKQLEGGSSLEVLIFIGEKFGLKAGLREFRAHPCWTFKARALIGLGLVPSLLVEFENLRTSSRLQKGQRNQDMTQLTKSTASQSFFFSSKQKFFYTIETTPTTLHPNYLLPGVINTNPIQKACLT